MAEDIYLKGRNVVSEPWERVAVDIIVPFHGQYDRVGQLVTSLYRGTSSNPFRLILVDDGSPNSGFMASLEKDMERLKIGNLMLIRNSNQKGYAAACWDGMLASQQTHKTKPEGEVYPYVCFLQSDCLIEDVNWLRALFQTYQAHKGRGVKFVSARLDNPGGGDPRTKGTRAQKCQDIILEPESIADILEKDCYVPLTATFCHKDLFRHANGFFKHYPFGMYEDLEFACRMFACGFKQAISGGSYVKHAGGATFKTLMLDSQVKLEVEANFDRCCRDIKLLKNHG